MTDTPLPFRFRPKARILRLLGDQLIGNSRLAIFELVKNAFDADASGVKVEIALLGSEQARITVRDDGDGMSRDTIEQVWFVPGADHRERQRHEGRRTARFHRLPLGEKGLGRFAVHKLGEKITLVTRTRNAARENVVEINWKHLLTDRFLEELTVDVVECVPVVFPGDEHGTQILIEDLRQKEMTRGDLRRLYRQITSICSPFSAPNEFRVRLDLPGRERDLSGLPGVAEILKHAFWKFTFSVDAKGSLTWDYEFTNHLPQVAVQNRKAGKAGDVLNLDDDSEEPAEELIEKPERKARRSRRKVALTADELAGIGPMSGVFYVFDRDKEVISRMAEPELVTKYLNENGGVRVYRDGIRVYNYGERGDDWLGMDLRRVNQPTLRISRNVIVGAIGLSLETSSGLVEKTNREGFVENEAYAALRRIVVGALSMLEAERSEDKTQLRKLLGSDKGVERFDTTQPFNRLRSEARKLGADTALEPYILRIEKEFTALKETLLHAGTVGVGLAVVFHEIDRGVRELYEIIRNGTSATTVEIKAKELSFLLDGVSALLRRSERKPTKASELVRKARDLSAARMRFHQTRFECPLLKGEQPDFETTMAQGLMVGALTNLIDNSLYWLRVAWPDQPESSVELPRRIYIGTSEDFEGGPALVIADNGPGFKDVPELLTKPFFTRRPDGMGLGLYYVKLAMELAGGSVQFPTPADAGLPEGYEGAVVALVFKKP